MQHRGRQRKIHRQRDRVNDRRDERRSHDRRVEPDFRGYKRQCTADQLCEADDENEGDAYDKCNFELQMIEDQEFYEIRQGERQAAEDCDPDFFPDRFENVCELDLSQ